MFSLIAQTIKVDISKELTTSDSVVNPKTTISSIVENLGPVILGVGGIVAFVWFMIGAFNWIASGGDKNKIETAKAQITQGIVGLVLLASSFAIFSLIQTLLGLNIVK